MGPRRTSGRGAATPVKPRGRRRAIVGAAITVLLVAVLLFGILPTQDWFDQRRETRQTEAELAEVRAEKAEVERQQQLLETDAEIERRAKEDLGMVEPGEEAYNILPAPTDPIGLPEGWPFTGVERVFGAS